MTASNPVRAAGLVVYRKASEAFEYLLLQTSSSTHHWTPPKGHVDPGETEWVAAVRETKEEAGLDAYKDLEVLKDFTVVSEYECTTKYAGKHHKRVTYWLARLSNQDAKVKLSDEHVAFRWLPVEKACELVKFDTLQEVLKKCEAKLTST